MAEVEASKRRARSGRGGGINIIVMNAVLEACVSCGDVDLAVQLFEEMRGPMGCGVDGVSYGILLKVCPLSLPPRLPVLPETFMVWTVTIHERSRCHFEFLRHIQMHSPYSMNSIKFPSQIV